METNAARSDLLDDEPSDAETIENDPPTPKPKRKQKPKRTGRRVGRPPKPKVKDQKLEEKAPKVAKGPPARKAKPGRPRKETIRQQPKRQLRRMPKEPISLIEDDVIDRWIKVRKEKGFSADADVARFLLSWYLDGLSVETKSGSCCSNCHSPLSLYCQKCCASQNKLPASQNKLPTEAANTSRQPAPVRIKNENRETTEDDLKIHFDVNMGHEQAALESSKNLNAIPKRSKEYTHSKHIDNVQEEKSSDDAGIDDDYDDDVDDSDDDDDDDDEDDDDEEEEDYAKSRKKGNVSGQKRRANGKPKYVKFRYVCPFCNDESDKGEHTTHMKLHEDQITVKTDKNEYKCTLCTRKFKIFEYLIKHRRMQVGHNQCSTCNQIVSSKCEIRAHRKMHWREDVQWCKWCQKSMKHMSRSDFTQHLQNHETRAGTRGKGKCSEKAPALCSICGKSYKTKSLLETHVAAGHGTERPFACEVQGCGLTFKIRKYLKRHMMFHEEKKQICEMCGQKFHREIELKYHMQKHFGKKYQCEECHRRFVSNYSLKVHVDSRHKGIKRYACNVCGTRFVAQNSLVIHMRGHTNERPFRCNQCDATFKLKPALDKHMLRHTAQKPFRCEDCGQAYRCNTSFRNHRKKYHSDSVYTCKVCGMTFHVPSSFNFHMRMYHNEVAFEEQLNLVSTTNMTLQQQQQQQQQLQQQQLQHLQLQQQLQQLPPPPQLQPPPQQQLQQLTPLEPAAMQHMEETSRVTNDVLKEEGVFFNL